MITVDAARQTLGTVALNMTDAQIGTVLNNLRCLCNTVIDTTFQNAGTCGTVSL
jgi:hypothetical protein